MKKHFFFYALCVRKKTNFLTNEVLIVLQKDNQKSNQSYAEYVVVVDFIYLTLMIYASTDSNSTTEFLQALTIHK